MDVKQEFSHIASAIRAHRRAQSLTQKQVAKMAKLSTSVVFDIEHGKESVLTKNLFKVLAALDLKIELVSPISRYILDDEEKED